MKSLIILSLKTLLSIFFLMTFIQVNGQESLRGKAQNDCRVSGTVIDESSGQPVQYASVAIFRAKDSTLLTGAMSGEDGKFIIEGLPYGQFYIQITFVGYQKQRFGSIVLSANQKTTDLGKIKINPVASALKTVVIEGVVPPEQFKIDKRVVNIEQDITAAGGTLADALQNVPSIQTDVEGNVTLRGSSNFTVLIDGRPSPVDGSEALQQIPANLVKSVEIITNPSAKYEAEGSAGIVNVIMKKQKLRGESGMFTATAGLGDKYSVSLNLNYKISKFNFSLGAMYRDMRSDVKNYMNNSDTLGTQLIKNQIINGSGNFHRQGKEINGGISYNLNAKNTLTLSGSLGNRLFKRPMTSNYHDSYFNFIDPPTDIYYLNAAKSEDKRIYRNVNIDYNLKFNDKGHEISASAYFTGGPDDEQNNLQQDTTDANWNTLGKKKIVQQSVQNSDQTQLRTKIDYSLPLGEKGKLEAGYQGTYSKAKGNSYLDNFLGNVWVQDSAQTDRIVFKDQIQAFYVTFSNSLPVFDYQIGLRTEYEDRSLNQEIQNKKYTVNRIDLFPSVHLSRQLPWNLEVQASYTRRINRPRNYNIYPFVLRIDPQTIRQGNPGLLPEFANSFELNLQKKLTGSSYLSLEGFLRQTSDLIQQITTFEPATQITTTTFDNINHDRSIGTEFMVYLELVKWFKLNTSFNYFNYHMFGTPIASVDNKINTWNVRVNPTFNLAAHTTFQATYSYNAPTIRAQGKRSGFYFSTLALRQGLLKQKCSLTLQVRDLFGKPSFVSTTESTNQHKYSKFQRESKIVLLTFSYRFNNYRVKKGQEDTENNEEQDMNDEY